ncbi:hypothetical protein F1654_01455 [Alkalicaulis satelles]|uniref:Uncharacterized protein n=1 Tax=Alkalicaulis satelles TaxID=2609175 RepID=A0A5M6ZLY5_9PROT|nr:hypothetical protein [Alkalicaulis satelles]KAA5804697.1 hypothetical protein F1654_01455 [Alkalicaulis satelles]
MAGQAYPYSVRYGAREPWLAPWPRAGLYLVWRAVIALIRPAVFIALLAGAALSAREGWSGTPMAPLAPDHSVETRIEAQLAASVPAGARPLDYWNAAMGQALASAPGRPPDIPLAASLARALPGLKGRDALAFHVLTRNRSPAHVNADLRARPAWERASRLESALTRRLGQGAHLDPPELIFASPALVQRLERARALYGPALDSAEAWFLAPRGAALNLSALPGWGGEGAAIVFGDGRDLAVHGCALLAAQGRRPGACASLPAGRADPVLAGLLLQTVSAAGEAAPGWRLIAGAYVSGHLDPDLARQLALGPDAPLGREALMASLMPLLVEAGGVWSQPWRYQDAVADAADEYARAARLPVEEAHAIAHALNAVRRSDGAIAALRSTRWLSSPRDAERLARIARAAPGQMLALDALAGPDILHAVRTPVLAGARAPAPRDQGLRLAAFALAALAFLLVAAALSGAALARRTGRAGVLARLDAAMSRLILGRNS